jgi:hypothetical protein
MSDTLPAVNLGDLAEQINREHAECEQALNAALTHAIAAGRLLMAAKAQIPHGGWLPWVRNNCRCSVRAAQTYMQVASRAEELESKAQRAAPLSYRDALAMLAKPGEQTHEPREEGTSDPFSRIWSESVFYKGIANIIRSLMPEGTGDFFFPSFNEALEPLRGRPSFYQKAKALREGECLPIYLADEHQFELYHDGEALRVKRI